MFSVYYMRCMSAHVVMSHVPVIRYRLNPSAPYNSPPTVIKNLELLFEYSNLYCHSLSNGFTQSNLQNNVSLERRYSPEKLRRSFVTVQRFRPVLYLHRVVGFLRSGHIQ